MKIDWKSAFGLYFSCWVQEVHFFNTSPNCVKVEIAFLLSLRVCQRWVTWDSGMWPLPMTVPCSCLSCVPVEKCFSEVGDPALHLPQVWKPPGCSQEFQCSFLTIASGSNAGMIHPASSHQHNPRTSDQCFSPRFILIDIFQEHLGQIKKYFPGTRRTDALQLPGITLGSCGSLL